MRAWWIPRWSLQRTNEKERNVRSAERRKNQLFRKMMVLNTARVQAVEPELTSGGNQGYDILGELIVVEQQLLAGKNPVWAGIDHATNDVEMDDSSIEVKSTVTRYGYEVTISSLYQMRPPKGKSLSLAFLRFEKSVLGRSIDDVANSLKTHGYDAIALERALTKAGLEEGRVARNQKYKILEWKLYPVDETFPSVTESSFKNDRLPPNIVRFTYTVDLSGVTGQSQI